PRVSVGGCTGTCSSSGVCHGRHWESAGRPGGPDDREHGQPPPQEPPQRQPHGTRPSRNACPLYPTSSACKAKKRIKRWPFTLFPTIPCNVDMFWPSFGPVRSPLGCTSRAPPHTAIVGRSARSLV